MRLSVLTAVLMMMSETAFAQSDSLQTDTTQWYNQTQAIDGIANLCGYDSDSTLRYAFKAKTGLSMREWRRRNLK